MIKGFGQIDNWDLNWEDRRGAEKGCNDGAEDQLPEAHFYLLYLYNNKC